jgi:hypothetical protein
MSEIDVSSSDSMHGDGGEDMMMSSAMTIFLLLQFQFSTPLSISVRGANQAFVPIAYISVQRVGRPGMIFQVAALDGRAEIPDLEDGPYSITADAPGYQTSYLEINMPFDSRFIIELHPQKRPLPNRPQSGPPGHSIRWIFHKLFG